MDFAYTDEDEAFRAELLGWLDEHLQPFLDEWADTGDDDDAGGGRRRWGHGPDGAAPGLAAHAQRGPLGRHHLAGRVGRARRHRDPVDDLQRGDGPGPHARHLQRQRPLADRPHDHQVGHRRAEGPLDPQHPRRRRPLVPGVHRARGRQRPRQPPHPRPARRRRLRAQRPEDLDLVGPHRQVGPLPRPHRRHRDRGGPQARRHHRPHHRHGGRRHRGAAHPRHRRRGDVLRDLLHRRPRPAELPARRRGRGVAGGHGHARQRTGRHRRPGHRHAQRPRRHGQPRPEREPRRARRPRARGRASPGPTSTSSTPSSSTTGRSRGS